MMPPIFDHIADRYDKWYADEVGALAHYLERELVMEFIKPRPGETVLDLGCGTGIYALELAQMGLQITGIDVSSGMLDVAREKANRLNLAIMFRQGDLGQVDFGSENFDKVISICAMEFFLDPTDIMRRAFQAVKPGGRMIFATIGNKSHWSTFYKRRAKTDSSSVFNRATFYTGQQLIDLFPQGKRSQSGCLFFPPDLEPFSRVDALALEAEAKAGANTRPGFICGLWEKD